MNALTAPRKVLHILDRMQPGGAEVRLLELMGRLCPHEFRVDICALSGLSGSLDPRVRALGGRVVPLRLDLSAPWRFLRLLRQERYDVVHSHVLFASGAILALAARAGVPVRVAHFQATEDGYRPTWRRHVLSGRRCVCSSIAMPPTSSRAAKGRWTRSGDPTGAAIRVVEWSMTRSILRRSSSRSTASVRGRPSASRQTRESFSTWEMSCP